MQEILHIVGSLNVGGAEVMIMNIYRNINRDNYIFDFVVSGAEIGCFEDEVKALGGHIHHVTKRSDSIIKHVIELYKVVKKHQYKVVHFHTQNAFLTSLEIVCVKFAGAKKIITHSHNTSDWRNQSLIILHKCCRKLLHKLTDIKLACGKEAANYLFGTTNNVTLVPLPVDCSKFMFTQEKYQKVRQQCNIGGAKVYAHVGRFFDVKNHAFLIEVFSEILKFDESSYLWLIGDGELKEIIEKLVEEKGISNHVIFWGNVREVYEKLIAADAFVFPSKYEGFPTTVIEAQAAGLPCYISDAITPDIKITDLVTRLSLTYDAKDWAKYIVENMERHKNERSGYNYIINEKYGLDVVINMMERVYEK